MSARRRSPEADEAATADDSAAFKRRLEPLVLDLLGRRFKTADDLWNLQLQLLTLQRDIQAAITKRKKGPKTDQVANLDALRDALWHARRFGDAFAWVLFKGERRRIYPLAENQRVPVPPEDLSSRGVAAIAADLMAKGFGFPLLHDITEILRVGDLTFFFGEDGPRTVEVKTEVVGSEPSKDGTTHTLRVVATWPMDESDVPMARSDGPKPPLAGAAFSTDRFRRQISRMTKARVLSTAEVNGDGRLVEVDGLPTLLVQAAGTSARSHWPLLRKLVRESRNSGFATGAADQAVMYAAIYRKEGFDNETAMEKIDEFPAALLRSGILFDAALSDRNSIVVSILPDSRGHGAHLYQPYFLYPLPRSAVLDLLHDRLRLFSVVNLGRIAASLEDAGFRVKLAGTDAEYRRSPLRVFTDIEVGPRRMRVELGGLHMPITEMIMEGSPPSYFVQWAQAAARAAAVQAPTVLDSKNPVPRRARRVSDTSRQRLDRNGPKREDGEKTSRPAPGDLEP
jgi:hypothetical protein